MAQLERERNQYQAKLAELEQDNRRIADKLAQEREVNGELAARLDDARVLLSEQGINTRSASSYDVERSGRETTVDGDYRAEPPGEPTQRRKRPSPRSAVSEQFPTLNNPRQLTTTTSRPPRDRPPAPRIVARCPCDGSPSPID